MLLPVATPCYDCGKRFSVAVILQKKHEFARTP
jgi:hypothetical protein